MSTLKEMHDEILSKLPEGVEHDRADCALCNDNISKSNTTEGGDMKTYTEEEFTTAVKEAVAPLQAAADAKVAELQKELDALKADKADEEVAGQIAEVRNELDKAELRATKAEEDYKNLIAYFEKLEADKAETARREARKEEIRKLAETAGFKAEHIDARLADWAAMSDEVFAAISEDWKVIASKTETETEKEELSTAAAETAMNHVRNDKPNNASLSRTVFSARHGGVDVRKF